MEIVVKVAGEMVRARWLGIPLPQIEDIDMACNWNLIICGDT